MKDAPDYARASNARWAKVLTEHAGPPIIDRYGIGAWVVEWKDRDNTIHRSRYVRAPDRDSAVELGLLIGGRRIRGTTITARPMRALEAGMVRLPASPPAE